MTVKELYDELGKLIDYGHADTRVIANAYSKEIEPPKESE